MSLDTQTIHGLDGIVAKLRAVKYDMARKTGRAALRKAVGVVVKAAQRNVAGKDDPATGRSIASNVAARWNGKLNKTTGDLGFRIGVLGGAVIPKGNPDGGKGGATPHWRLIELGTEKMPATPFLRPALENNTGQVISTFVTTYQKGLDKVLSKAGK